MKMKKLGKKLEICYSYTVEYLCLSYTKGKT